MGFLGVERLNVWCMAEGCDMQQGPDAGLKHAGSPPPPCFAACYLLRQSRPWQIESHTMPQNLRHCTYLVSFDQLYPEISDSAYIMLLVLVLR
mmetsp:Transcript_67726/g.113731  ORF Transcript_67726/g.113731 Transcript_67726/m.113731 type:complete len:93 (+) Transcript_67726:1136-1414(+)